MDEKTEAFMRSYDFMKLGQALNHKNWQVAMLCVGRLQKAAAEAGITAFDGNLKGIRQCIISKDRVQAQNILALLIAKRTQYLNRILQEM